MPYLICILLVLVFKITCFSQEINPHTYEPTYGKYQLVDSLVLRNRIKSITDSSYSTSPGTLNIKRYDSLGRIIGDQYHSFENFDNPFIYKTNGDTIWCFRYMGQNEKLYSSERFVLNKMGQTTSYLNCGNYYFKDSSFFAHFIQFFYDERNRIKSRIEYVDGEFPGILTDTVQIDPKNLLLNEVIYYNYTRLKNGNKLIIGKHALGKPEWRKTDSAIYDKHNRLIRFNSYSHRGFRGELGLSNMNEITDYKYDKNSLTITHYTIYCRAELSNYECFMYDQTQKDIDLIIYNPDKTKKEEYGFYNSGEKYLKSKYSYTYY